MDDRTESEAIELESPDRLGSGHGTTSQPDPSPEPPASDGDEPPTVEALLAERAAIWDQLDTAVSIDAEIQEEVARIAGQGAVSQDVPPPEPGDPDQRSRSIREAVRREAAQIDRVEKEIERRSREIAAIKRRQQHLFIAVGVALTIFLVVMANVLGGAG